MERVTILDEGIRDPMGLCELSGLETSKQLTNRVCGNEGSRGDLKHWQSGRCDF